MSFMITAECIICSACAMECPVRAITSGPSQFEINPGVCIECEGYYPVARCKWACPVDACVPERAHYMERAATMAAKGSPPVVVTRAQPSGALAGVG